MSKKITPSTYIRDLSFSVRRQLSDFLDHQDMWKDVIVSIRNRSGEPRYSQLHVRRFEALLAQGRSPTVELINDWGTSNPTVGDLVDILRSHSLLAAASLLLPDAVEEFFPAETQQVSPTTQTKSVAPLLVTKEHKDESVPVSSALQTQPLCEGSGPHAAAEPTRIHPVDNCSCFTYAELKRITRDFDDRPTSDGGSRLGEGGFGTVYKGFLHDKPVAVKRLTAVDHISADELQIQFNQEIQTLKLYTDADENTLIRLKHENLVDMVGFSCDGQHPCLVYAFMANGSLLDRLSCLNESPPLSWQQRCSIAVGTSKGLEYLHSNHHIHRDVKSANILLDERFVAKISDFGLTRASAKKSSTTMMTERIVGTGAYMAPEALRGEITPKSDIFSFGVVLLEILSGLPPADDEREQQFLMDMRYDIDDEDEDLSLEDFLDKKMTDFDMSQVESIYSLACNCLHERKNRRPSVNQVLAELRGVLKSILITNDV